MNELFRLKITSAVVIGGIIKKAGEIVELVEREARDLLRREKAVPHDGPMPDAPSVAVEAAAPVVQPAANDDADEADHGGDEK